MAEPRYGKGIKGFVAYTLVYYSTFMKDVNTMTSPLQKFILDVIN